MSNNRENSSETGIEIAVIGMAGRFPGAGNIKQFWELLKNGVEAISFFPDDQLREAGVSEELLDNPNYVKAGASLEDKEYFDAAFFGYSPKEAGLMDPQMRLFHQCCWEGLEDAGYDPVSYYGAIGLYAGAANSFYWEALTLASGVQEDLGSYATGLLTNSMLMTTHISHKLDLKGPALNIFTTCSTSLVAVHLACRALLTGECDMALAGGVNVSARKESGYLYQEGMIFSPDGHCRAFDARAGGAVFGDGLGVAIFKRLQEAIADGDNVYAVVKGSAVNNDGMEKVSYAAPAKKGQENVIRTALEVAGTSAESITYIETHGTGTILGDPIEIEALKSAFNTAKKKYCAIGSVKTNLGHLDVAAGITGFIKTVLALKHKQIPPSLHYQSPNPNIDFENSPFYVNTALTEWKNNQYPLRAGVSSFGIGGTNAHVVLEAWPGVKESREVHEEKRYQLILLSAKTETALEQLTGNLAKYLENNPVNIADAAYTLQVGRRQFKQRKVAVCTTAAEAAAALYTPGSENVYQYICPGDNKNVVFMFSGQGSQYVNMGRDLYRTESVFRQEMDRCFEILNPLVDYDFKEIIYPSVDNNRSYRSNETNIIDRTEIAQPIIFAFEYALARLLISWGIEPKALIGHSIGEYTAACLAGVFSLADALTLVTLRGQLMQQMPTGAMISIPVAEQELLPLLNDELSLAAVNGPEYCVVSGPHDAIAAFEKQLAGKYNIKRLHTSHAFHSSMMDPILDTFAQKAGLLTLNEPRLPFISNITGQWISGKDATDPTYWAKHIRHAVRFSDGILTLLKKIDNAVFLEVGAGKALATFVRQHKDRHFNPVVFNLVRHPNEETPDDYYLLNKTGQLWLYGIKINWPAYHRGETRYRVPLPSYPFEKQRYWIDGDLIKMGSNLLSQKPRLNKPNKKNKIDDFFYLPLWKAVPSPHIAPAAAKEANDCWLVFSSPDRLSTQLLEQLRVGNHTVITVEEGPAFAGIGERKFTLNPASADHYIRLLTEISASGLTPGRIVHLWSLTTDNSGETDSGINNQNLELEQNLGFYSLIYLAQAIKKKNIAADLQLTVVSNHIQEVTGEEVLSPGKSFIIGAIKVIPQEFPNITCLSIDVELLGAGQENKTAIQILNEISIQSNETIVAYRKNRRWLQTFERVKIAKNEASTTLLHHQGVYLITGGLGRIGLVLAEYLIRSSAARVILTSRKGPNEAVAPKLRELEEMGGQVMVCAADAADYGQMQEVIVQAEKQFGPIKGVIHAAGVVKGKSIPCAVENLTATECDLQFQPKVKGLLVLAALFKDRELDFCLLTSSLASVLGGLGFASYAAANAFMDAFVKKQGRDQSRKWLSVNWDEWQFAQSENGLAISPEEGQEALQRLLAWHNADSSGSEETQVIVSTTDLQPRIDRWIGLKDLAAPRQPLQETLQARPAVTTLYMSAQNPLEEQIIGIWQRFLGFAEIGVLDDFFELGGDSLKAMTLVSRIQKELNVGLPLAEFFNRPSIRKLAEYISASDKLAHNAVELAEEKEYYPLSLSQKRLYVLQQLDLESRAYNMPQIFRLEGDLDVAILTDIFKHLIRRHESLRTSFHLVKDEPVQKVHSQVDFEIEYLATDEHGPTRTFIRAFDLSIAPLLRVGVVREKENSNLLLIDMHHIISDGISHVIMVKDFTSLFNGKELPQLQIRYRDYSEWQNRTAQKESVRKQQAYWLEAFAVGAGEIPVLNLPTDYSRPEVQVFDGGTFSFQVGEAQAKALNRAAQQEGVTLFMILLALYAVLLAKISGQEDIVIGTPVKGRRHADLEEIIGMFVNTLALRNSPWAGQTFGEFLHQVKETALAAFENQDYPFEELVEQVAVNRDVSRNPLFDVMFVMQNMEFPKIEIPGLTLTTYEYENKISKFDLTLWVTEGEDRLWFTFEYCTKLFKSETIERFAGFFKGIVSSVLAAPGKMLTEIDMIPTEEKQRILFDFNQTEVDYPCEKTVHALFKEQAERMPDRTAILGHGQTRTNTDNHVGAAPRVCPAHNVNLSYGHINEQSDQLAGLLIEKDVLPDMIVGIMMERSVDMIIAIYGILKAGSAYLPIDPEYPQERIDYMLKDSGATILLTDHEKEIIVNCQLLIVNCKLLKGRPSPGLHHSNRLAYIIYTSGSTGRPKGVMVEHASVVNLIWDLNRCYPFGETDVYLQKTSYLFDVSVSEMFGWFLGGGGLALLDPGAEKEPLEILAAIERYGITHINFVPSMFRVFVDILDRPDTRKLATLRYIFLAGEALPGESVRAFQELKSNILLENLYGPTEAAVYASRYSLRDWGGVGKAPIGKPLANTRLYILDKNNNPQPVGIAGELHIAGVGLARGYLNRPELTEEKFCKNRSYGSYRTYINYKTGDLAQWLYNGNIEFLGRIDHQVKIRGFRVELEEIEYRLQRHEKIKEVAAAIKKDKNDHIHLCAYYVSEGKLTVTELRAHLSKDLPGYMLPSFFIQVERIPLTPGGKVDRNRLPEPGAQGLASDAVYIAPRNTIEKALADVWQKVLGITTVSVDDNFFELGGDSIKAIQVVSRMKKTGFHVEMRDILRNPRISELALSVKKITRVADQASVLGPVPLTPIQKWFFTNRLRHKHHFNQAVMLYSQDGFDRETVEMVFKRLQQHHDALRMTFREEDGCFIQYNHGVHDSTLSLEEHDFRGRENAGKVKEEMEASCNEIQAGINLETGPLMRLGLFHLDDGDRLLIVVHHLVIDGVSWRILFEDLETLYRQYKHGHSLQLPLKTDAFKMWAEQLLQYSGSEAFLQEKAYWAELEKMPFQVIKKDLELAGTGEDETGAIETQSFTLTEEETRLLLTGVNQAFGTEINDVLLTALGLAVKKVYGIDRLLIALEGHGREAIPIGIDISRTIGWFTGLYPVLLDISPVTGDNELARCLKNVKEKLRQVPHKKGIGYGILRYLTPGEYKQGIDFRAAPQILFNYLGQFDQDLESRSFRIASESTGETVDKNDQREFELEINGMITAKRLVMSISYSKRQYNPGTIRGLWEQFKGELSRIIHYCVSRETRELTPSDLTYRGISMETLDHLQKQYHYSVEDIYTLSSMQEGMLFYSLFEDRDRPAYFEQISYQVQGELNVPLVEKSLNGLFKRHEILRTVFFYEGLNRPLQGVLRNRTVEFYFEDLRQSLHQGSSSGSKEQLLREFKEKDRKRYFDLSKDVLMRVAVLRLTDSEYQVVWSFHHILMDGWCVGILISEFSALYAAALENREAQLPPVKPYRLYIQWLEGREKEQTRTYWRNYLAGYDEPAAVPRKSSMDSFTGGARFASTGTRFDKVHTAALHEIANRSHVTINTLIQTVWGIVLGKYNSRQDVVFGVLVSGRPPEIEGVDAMIGCFINTIPVRIAFDENTTFNRLLQQVQESAIASEPHHYFPLAEIQAESSVKQHLLDHIIEFQNYPVAERIENVGTDLSHVEVFEQGNYDFYIVVYPGEQIYLSFSFNTGLYQRELVEQLGFNSLQVLEQAIGNESLRINDIVFLTEAEKHKILFEFNNRRADFPQDKTVYHFVEEHAEHTPDRVGVVGPASITYRYLNEQSHQLAGFLIEKGVLPDNVVGIMMERSIEMIIGILGIFKSGSAYLPIDPEYPQERIQYMLQDSKVKILINKSEIRNPKSETNPNDSNSNDQNKKHFPWDVLVLNFENLNFDIVSNFDIRASDFNSSYLAYIIYTSGSTGKPKGAMVEHIGMMNHMQAKIDDLQLTEKSIVAQNASHTFDISVWQFFSALITGGKTVIFPGALVLEPGKFVAHIVKHDVNILEVVPSYLSLLLDYLGNQDTLPLALQYLLVTGEELKPLLVRKWFERYPGIKMVNAYGPTEASDDITHYIMDKALGASERERIPIGKPLPNMNIYIVDDSMQLCPIGVKGEICVAGVGVGRGYIGDEAKTKQVFMEDPFVSPITTHHSPLTKNRLYKTGDVGRWLPDGNIEFFGRKDYQVKIRGFRIELGEIENRLLTHDAVKEAVVLDKEDEQGNKYLCAYVVLHPHPIAGPAELKEYLAERLPDYMVPAYFLQLETMPLTPNGKIDRKALPEPEGGGPAAEYVPPRDRVEAKLVEIWAEVLGKEKGFIGIEDNFFRLGGHSLRAVALVSKIHQALNVKLTLAVLFKTPTVKDLAQHIKGAAEDRYAAIEPVEKRDYYELSSTQRRLYILHQMDPGSTVYNMATVVRLPGAPDIERLEKTFIKLIDRHESLRTSFHMEGSRPVQRVHGIVDFKVENYDLQKNSAEAAAVFRRPFYLSEAPLLKVGVLKTADGAFVLAAVMHHIISDGVSLRILEKDFSVLYRDGSPAPLRIQYKDFSQWQNSRKQDTHIKTLEDFWLKEFSGEIPVLELCLDYPRPAVQSFAGGILRFEVGPMETRQIKSLAWQEGVTLFMLMLAATYTWLAKLSGQEDIVVGTPVAGRRHADLEPVIGMFVNTLPLRAHPAGGKSFLEFLAEVKEKTLDAFENQEYQFEDLVENAPVNRDTARNPLFDVMYTLIQVDETPGAGKPRDEKNITESHQEINEEATAKFDLNLELTVTEKLAVSLEYCRKLFKRETIERFAVYFKQLIGVIGKSPMALMADIEIITDREKKQLLYDFNDTATDYPVEKPIHFLFEEQESKTPDCVGLVGQVSITYRHLNEQSDQLAALLIEKGVLPDTMVGIMMDRSVEMMIAIYGILKAGGAYLPIDPEYPHERIDYMLKDSGATILLTDYEREIIVNCQLLIVNCKLLKGPPRRGLHHSNRLAYIIYTSGSTGKPKGVMIPHRAVHNFIQGMAAVIDFAPGKIILALTTICFDIFLLETLLPLSRGMRVVIADEKHQADMVLLEKLIIKTNIEMLQATPTRMRLFLSPKGAGAPAVAGPVSCLRNLKEIMVGGETFPTKLLEDLQGITSAKIYNMYGPTETTVWSAVRDVTGKREVYIGGPIANTQIYIFNSKNYLQPIGVAGELCIGGMGLAMGYLSRPELTNKSFAGVKGGLFQKRPLVAYKTGDLARWLAPGEIEFLGRIDNQVKIRGFRIETEEIANCLVKHPHVNEAVVIVRENNGENYLGAFIVTAGADVTTEELNRYLARSLPAYMIPAVFVKLEKIPLTLNGKLDRRALPVEEFTPGAIYRAPRNQIDEKLTEIWEQVLGIAKEVIGIDHDFFELGGQSMKAIQFIAGANRENFNISIIDVFKYKTIAALSDYILSLPGIHEVKAIAETMSRQNQDFIPDTYPSYFPCVLGAIRERICYENQLQLSKGIFIMADGTALLALGYPEDSSLQDKLNYMEFPFARRLGNFKPLSEIIGYTTRIKRFSSLEKEMKYCSARLNKKELVLLTGTTYFLNYSPDYHMEPAQWLKKMDDLFAQYDKSKKLDLVGHIFVLVDIVEDGYILYDSTYNYYGKVPRENLHQAVKGNSAIEISKGHRSYNAYRPYQVIEVERNRSVHIDDRVLILETMKKFVQLSVTPEIFKGKEKDNQYVAFLGIGAIKELARVIDRSLNEKDSLADLYRYTTTIINSWKYKYIFFRDFLMDFSTYFSLPREVFLGIEGTISHWHGLHTRIREKKDQEDELITVFNTAIKQVEKIYEEQATVFAGLEQTIKQMK